MSKHTQHYFDLNPRTRESPPDWAIVAGAFFAVAGVWLITAFLFSL